MTIAKQAIVFIYIAGQPVPAGMLTTFVDGRYTSSDFAYGSRKYSASGWIFRKYRVVSTSPILRKNGGFPPYCRVDV